MLINIFLALLDMPLLVGGYLLVMGFLIGSFFYILPEIPSFYHYNDLFYNVISFLSVLLFFILYFVAFYYIIKFHIFLGKGKLIKFFKWHFSDYNYAIKMELSVFWIALYELFISMAFLIILCPDCVTNESILTMFSYALIISIPDSLILLYSSKISDKIEEYYN